MGSLLSCCYAENNINDTTNSELVSKSYQDDPFECMCGGTLTEHGCQKCHPGPRCHECNIPISVTGDICDSCKEDEEKDNYKDKSRRSNKRGYNVDFTDSGCHI